MRRAWGYSIPGWSRRGIARISVWIQSRWQRRRARKKSVTRWFFCYSFVSLDQWATNREREKERKKERYINVFFWRPKLRERRTDEGFWFIGQTQVGGKRKTQNAKRKRKTQKNAKNAKTQRRRRRLYFLPFFSTDFFLGVGCCYLRNKTVFEIMIQISICLIIIIIIILLLLLLRRIRRIVVSK